MDFRVIFFLFLNFYGKGKAVLFTENQCGSKWQKMAEIGGM